MADFLSQKTSTNFLTKKRQKRRNNQEQEREKAKIYSSTLLGVERSILQQ
jgi:hypothetical protein